MIVKRQGRRRPSHADFADPKYQSSQFGRVESGFAGRAMGHAPHFAGGEFCGAAALPGLQTVLV